MKRRTFLQGTLAAGAAGLAASAGLLIPRMVLAEDAPRAQFDAKSLDDTLKAMAVTPEESDKVKVKAPEIAENGAVVPVTVSAEMEGVTELSILVANNPTPLAATFILGEGAKAEASTRIKMGKTSDVIALAKAGDKAYSAKQNVKVTIGGCGG
jgi:sulfur-oxidizing protein SoxY